MDPNQTLRDLRETVRQIERTFSTGTMYDLAERMADLFTALDNWLTSGGFHPKDWTAAGVAARAARAKTAAPAAWADILAVISIPMRAGEPVTSATDRLDALGERIFADEGVSLRQASHGAVANFLRNDHRFVWPVTRVTSTPDDEETKP